MNRQQEKGFTLVELLIVIAIIGVLAGVLFLIINPFEQFARARDIGRLSSVEQLGHALQRKVSTNGGGYEPLVANWQTNILKTVGEIPNVIIVPQVGTNQCGGFSPPNAEGNICYSTSLPSDSPDAIVWTLAESKNYTVIAGCSPTQTTVIAWIASQGITGITCFPSATTVPTPDPSNNTYDSITLYTFSHPNTSPTPTPTTTPTPILTPAPGFMFAAGGDIGANSNTSATLDLIAKSSSQFYLTLGDLDYGDILPESSWCSYMKTHLGGTFPIELLSGNHEDGGEQTGGGLIDNFIQCLPDRLGATGTYGREYYFDYPASAPVARFIMISPGLTFANGGYYNYSVGTTHYNWVANTIDNARASGIKWVVVGMHKDCISMGIMSCEIGNDIFNLLVSKKVDLVLQGHDHDYQRSKQLALNSTNCAAIQAETYNSNCVVNDGTTGNYTKDSGTVLVIVGTIGRDLHTISTSDGDAPYFVKWMGSNSNPTNGFIKFTVFPDQLTVSADFTGSTAPNNFTDSFSITSSTITPVPLTPTPTPQPGGSITLRAASSGNNGAGGSALTINIPSGTANGDVMVAHVVVRTAGNTITAPVGWTLIKRQDSSSSIATATYWKLAGLSEPASYTWSFGTSGQASGGIASYIGVNTTSPIDASLAQYNSSTSTVSNSGVTTTTANDMLVFAVGITVSTTVNPPSGFIQEWSTTSTTSTTSEMSQEIFPTVGATGTITGSHNGGSNSNITYLIALKHK